MTFFRKTRTYLDWASSAPVSYAAKLAFAKALNSFGNPSAPHTEGRLARDILEDARTRIARLASVRPDAVIFTSGATEANNLAIQGIVKNCSSGEPVHILYQPTSHASVREVVQALESATVVIEEIAYTDGAIDLVGLKKQLRPETGLVIVDAVCGEMGTTYAVRDVSRVIKEVGSKALLHVDASQLPRSGAFELTRLGADTLTLDAQKVGGVRGIGVLLMGHGVRLAPLMQGGGQEQGLRPGTEVPSLAAAFATALEEAARSRDEFSSRALRAREELCTTIIRAIPDTLVNQGKNGVPQILNLSFPGRDTDYLVALLDQAGFAVSTKSSCETDSEGSRVVLAMYGDTARAASTLRISWGPATPKSVFPTFVKALIHSVRFLDANALY